MFLGRKTYLPWSFVARAESALARAKHDSRGSVVMDGDEGSRRRQEVLHVVPAPGGVIEG